MGYLISSKQTKEGKVRVRLEMSPEEYSSLKGNMHGIYLFSENTAEIETRFSKRGTNEATKYFLIPRGLRKGINFRETVHCQRIDIPSTSIFIFVVEKA